MQKIQPAHPVTVALDARSWEERQLTAIIVRAAESAVDGAIMYERAGLRPHTSDLRDVVRYLCDAMDWFVAARPPPPDLPTDNEMFEAWLVERWLKHLRSEAYHRTAEYEFLRGEWERGR